MTSPGNEPQQQGPYGQHPQQGQYPPQYPQQYGQQYPPPGGQYPYGQYPQQQPPRSKAPWLWGGLALIVVAAVTVTLVLTLGGGKKHHDDKAKNNNNGGNSKTSSPRNAVQTWLDADKTHNVSGAQAVVCPAKRKEVSDSNSDVGLNDQPSNFGYTITKVQTSGNDAIVDVKVTAPADSQQQGSQQGVFQVVKQSADWFVCDVNKEQPTGPAPSQNPPAGQQRADSPANAAVGWLQSAKADSPQMAANYVCSENRSEVTDPNSELYVNPNAAMSSLQWSVAGTQLNGTTATVIVHVELNESQEDATFTARQENGAWFVCGLQEG